jgi:hypothetical protein
VTAAAWRFKIERGATFHRRFTLSNKATGLPVDITGATIELEIFDVNGASVLLLTTVAAAGVTIDDGPGGVWSIDATVSQTTALTESQAIGFLRITYPSAPTVTDRIAKAEVTID